MQMTMRPTQRIEQKLVIEMAIRIESDTPLSEAFFRKYLTARQARLFAVAVARRYLVGGDDPTATLRAGALCAAESVADQSCPSRLLRQWRDTLQCAQRTENWHSPMAMRWAGDQMPKIENPIRHDLPGVRHRAGSCPSSMIYRAEWGAGWYATHAAVSARSHEAAAHACNQACHQVSYLYEDMPDGHRAERLALQDLMAAMFDRPAVQLSQTDTVVQLARVIYDEKAFDRYPILADALEDAGFEHAETLDKLRSGDRRIAHRGYWLLDVLTGRKP